MPVCLFSFPRCQSCHDVAVACGLGVRDCNLRGAAKRPNGRIPIDTARTRYPGGVGDRVERDSERCSRTLGASSQRLRCDGFEAFRFGCWGPHGRSRPGPLPGVVLIEMMSMGVPNQCLNGYQPEWMMSPRNLRGSRRGTTVASPFQPQLSARVWSVDNDDIPNPRFEIPLSDISRLQIPSPIQERDPPDLKWLENRMLANLRREGATTTHHTNDQEGGQERLPGDGNSPERVPKSSARPGSDICHSPHCTAHRELTAGH